MSEVVINKCFGGFGLSHEAVMAYAERKGLTLYAEADEISQKHFGPVHNPSEYKGRLHYYKVPPEQYKAAYEKAKADGAGFKELNERDWYFSNHDLARDDPDLVAVVRELGEKASDRYARLEVVEIPENVEWEIDEYDGNEHIAEKHRTWA